ncbi:MAG: SpoIID/LytB domain-containing protein [Firmicutes bacterium]|nr:SpoIID/LytB domain-containing protein [Bacillota bacterium]
MDRKHLPLLLIVLTVFLAVAGYMRLRPAPELAPLRRAEPLRPEIPAPINQGAGIEPELRVYIAGENRVQTMKFEEYLQGVVAAEMHTDWPREALAAQAIVARTFTLQKIADEGGVPQRGAHASTDIKEFQAYDATRINDNVRQAVEATRGQVAVHGGRFIRGWFHAYSGPRTAEAREGLDYRGANPPYIKIVDSPAEGVIPPEERYWQASFPLSRVREVVRQVTGRDPGNIIRVEIAKQGPSGRVTRFRVNRTKISGPQLRLGLGSTVMRSAFVDSVTIEGNNLKMTGRGYGHGVGMCQWGARALAEQGKNAAEIVHYFYRDIDIAKFW